MRRAIRDSSSDLALKLLDAFGIPSDGVYRLTLDIQISEPARLTVEMMIPERDGMFEKIKDIKKTFVLEESE